MSKSLAKAYTLLSCQDNTGIPEKEYLFLFKQIVFKQLAPPPPVFVKVVEIIQKKTYFLLFYTMVCATDFSTLLI